MIDWTFSRRRKERAVAAAAAAHAEAMAAYRDADARGDTRGKGDAWPRLSATNAAVLKAEAALAGGRR